MLLESDKPGRSDKARESLAQRIQAHKSKRVAAGMAEAEDAAEEADGTSIVATGFVDLSSFRRRRKSRSRSRSRSRERRSR